MKVNKRLIGVFIMVFVSVNIFVCCKKNRDSRNLEEATNLNPVRISVFTYRADDDFIADVSKYLESIQAKNPEKVQFTFYDSKNSQILQNENIDIAINEGTDLLLVNLVDSGEGQVVINKAKENNLPVIFYNRQPVTLSPVKSYNKALFIGSDIREGSDLKAQILIDAWNSNKENIDRNKDNIMQYVTLSGGLESKEAAIWWKNTPEIIEKAGIKTEELGIRVANFDEELAQRAMEALFFKFGNIIEVIISDDDTMAIAAIKVLQDKGYNKGDESKTIPVVGVDAKEEARQLIDKGFMTGSVIQDPDTLAKALYDVGMNLVLRRNPLEGTNYVFDETGVAIRIPFEGVYEKNKD